MIKSFTKDVVMPDSMPQRERESARDETVKHRIAIVGSGWSGICAAQHVVDLASLRLPGAALSYDVTLYGNPSECQAVTVDVDGLPCDVGTCYTHAGYGNSVVRLCQRYGASTVYHPPSQAFDATTRTYTDLSGPGMWHKVRLVVFMVHWMAWRFLQWVPWLSSHLYGRSMADYMRRLDALVGTVDVQYKGVREVLGHRHGHDPTWVRYAVPAHLRHADRNQDAARGCARRPSTSPTNRGRRAPATGRWIHTKFRQGARVLPARLTRDALGADATPRGLLAGLLDSVDIPRRVSPTDAPCVQYGRAGSRGSTWAAYYSTSRNDSRRSPHLLCVWVRRGPR